MNKGKSTLDPGSTDIDDLLPESFFLLYQFRMEFGAHGYVHCTVGPTCAVAAMGDVPVAANDPIFFHHHANVDRLWACWQEIHETPDDAWLDQEYSFPDEAGTIQTRPVRDFLDSAALGYVYDNVSDCARSPGASLVAAAKPSAGSGEGRKTALVQQIDSVAINTLTTSVDLDFSQPMLQRTLSDLTQAGTVELVLKDIAAESHPGTLFHVYLAKKGEASSRKHVGTISWFGAFHHHHGDHKGPKKMTLVFDITDELAQLGGENLPETGLEVVIEATDGRVPVDAEQRERQAKEIRKLFRPEAWLRIGSLELRAVPPTEPPAQD